MTATRYGLSRGLLCLEYDRIHISDSDSCVVQVVSVLVNEFMVWTFQNRHFFLTFYPP